jgi:uncharacterized cupredoxin-like copper-binding protein
MRFTRSSFLGAVVVVVAAVSGGCGGYGGSKSKSSTPATTSGGPAFGAVIKTVTVHESEFKLSPSTISLSKPGTYVFKGVNGGTITHALMVAGNGVHGRSADIPPGQSATVKVTLPKNGSYQIFCPIDGHKAQGMKGTLTVGGAGAGTGTGTGTGTTTQSTTTTSRYGY